MGKDYADFLDDLPEEELLEYFPEKLPAMEDRLAAKRIEKNVLRGVQVEEKCRWNGKRIAAAVCCFLLIGAVGHEPILAAFQRVFHVLPGVGVYINDNEEEILEVRLLNPVQEKDGVRAELKDFYCKGVAIYGLVSFTGDGLPYFGPESMEVMSKVMKERFPMTWYDGEKERRFVPSTSGWCTDGEKTTEFHNDVLIYHERGTEPRGRYEFRIEGFDEPFVFEVVDPKTIKDVKKLGYSMTKNDTTVSARAFLREEGIEVEYYVIPSEEVRKAEEAQRRFYTAIYPYQLDAENYFYIQNADGEKMEFVNDKRKRLMNGYSYTVKGTAEDFPLTLHRSPFTGIDSETHTVSLPLPADGEILTENLPRTEFRYGTVEFLSVERDDVVWEDDNEYSDRTEDAAKVTYTYRVMPKEGLRQMYGVGVEIDAETFSRSGEGGWSEEAGAEETETILLKRTDAESIQLTLENPSYWIEGDYDIIIKKPGKE